MSRREQVVHDELEPCPYLDGEQARMPLRWQLRHLSPVEFDTSLAMGDRRVGRMLYRTRCPACSACEPIRIPVQGFRESRSQRRVWRRNQDVQYDMGPVTFTTEKLELYNKHKQERNLARNERQMSRRGYEGWFVNTCTRTVEIRYRVGDRLIGLGILDVGARDTSSVYFFFDPAESQRSLGVFSVLVEIIWLRQQSGRHHYLGLYVADCPRLSYKAAYYPHQRRHDGAWHRYADRDAPGERVV